MAKIEIRLPNKVRRMVEPGTPISEILAGQSGVLAAAVGNHTVGLDHLVTRSSTITPLTYDSSAGKEVYRRTLSFILSAAARRLFPKSHMVIGHSLAGGYYFDCVGEDRMNPANVSKLEAEMKELIRRDVRIRFLHFSAKQAMELFAKKNRPDKARLLKRSTAEDVVICELDGFYDSPIGPLAASTSLIRKFILVPYESGIVLRFPSKRDPNRMPAAADQTRLFAVYHESKRWSKIHRVGTVGDLNEVIAQGRFNECVQVVEALHEKKIAAIADDITRRMAVSRLVFVAGPSSSGKTTFSKRLGVQLRVNGLRPVTIGLDDYFVDREKTPKDDHGEYDFESLYALDIKTLNDHLVKLIKGREVELPRFSFRLGRRVKSEHSLRLEADQILIMEGIHGLNDKLTPRIPPRQKFKIYVSALTPLTIDSLNRISTTDMRLLRRTVRDHLYRGYSARDTIRRWPSVIRGESHNIFPYQESADVLFNTAVLYEIAVLKSYARRSLEEVSPEYPEFNQARRLLDFLNLFTEMDASSVPPTSILREFIGGSSFSY